LIDASIDDGGEALADSILTTVGIIFYVLVLIAGRALAFG
jgi:hypothetical protein